MPLTRVTTFTEGKLPFADLESEFNNIVNWINAFALTNPITDDVDFDGNFILNAMFRRLMRIRNAEKFPSIQAAIDDITSESDPQHRGGIVHCPPGIYDVSEPIILADDITIWGAGPGKSILQKNASFDDSVGNSMIEVNNVSNVNLLGFGVDGQLVDNNTGSGGMSAIDIREGCSNIVVDTVNIDDWGNPSEGTGDGRNDGVIVGGSIACERVWIRNCRMNAVRRNPIAAVNAEHLWILDNYLSNGGHSFIDIEPSSGHVHDLVIRGNHGDTCDEEGIVVFTATLGAILRATVYDNNVRGALARGIIARGVLSGNIDKNTVRDSGSTSMEVRDCKNIDVDGNQVLDGTGFGINVGGTQVGGEVCRDIRVRGNQVRGHSDDGIAVNGAGGTADSIDVEGNTVVDNTTNGIEIGSCSEVSIRGNRVRSPGASQTTGIQFTAGASNIVLTENTTSGHAAGIAGRANVSGEFVESDNMELET